MGVFHNAVQAFKNLFDLQNYSLKGNIYDTNSYISMDKVIRLTDIFFE